MGRNADGLEKLSCHSSKTRHQCTTQVDREDLSCISRRHRDMVEIYRRTPPERGHRPRRTSREPSLLQPKENYPILHRTRLPWSPYLCSRSGSGLLKGREDSQLACTDFSYGCSSFLWIGALYLV